ncbi:MAG: ArsR family transcriptional regulator [Chloroflexi bacterium]|nr:MAG: ArsR family transcriptional regulator [Chloroflexota bacterium]
MELLPSDVFKAMSVDTRVKIINILKTRGPLSVSTISEMLGVTNSAVSQHLKILRQVGLVRSERDGFWIPYAIDEEGMEKCRQILNEVCTCGCQEASNFREQDLNNANMTDLKKYESELMTELQTIRERISEIASGE